MPKPKVVVDTNIFVSAHLVAKGNPAKVINCWVEDKYTIILSTPIIEEIAKVLHRKGITIDRIERLLFLICQKAIMAPTKEKISVIKDDPNDNKFLECAVYSKADYIISGDKHLLDLEEYEGIKILTPKEFLEVLEKKENQSFLKNDW